MFRGQGDEGLIKEQLVERTSIEVDELEGRFQTRLERGVKFDSRSDAEAYIRRLRESTATTTTTSTTTSTTLPGATTTTPAP